MARLNRYFLRLVIIAIWPFASQVHADGLIWQLPADGAWVRYKLSEQGFFTIVFPAPVQKAYKSEKQQFDTRVEDIGALECEKHTFESTCEGPLTRGRRGWWSWRAKHDVCLHKNVPFGVVALKWAGQSHEWSGDKKRSPRVTGKSTKEMVIADMGLRAKSKLPELN